MTKETGCCAECKYLPRWEGQKYCGHISCPYHLPKAVGWEEEFESLPEIRAIRSMGGHDSTLNIRDWIATNFIPRSEVERVMVEEMKREDDFRKLPNMGSTAAEYIRIADKNKIYNAALTALKHRLLGKEEDK